MSATPRRRRDAGDLCQLRVELWAGVRVASAMVDDPETTPELRLRAVSALATAASVYAKILYDTEIEKRLAALEAADHHERNGHYG
jgi:hypothetical protein